MNPEATRLADLLDQWEEAYERGEEVSAEDLCRDNPDLLTELKRQIEALQSVDQRLTDSSEQSHYLPQLDSEITFLTKVHQLRLHARGGLGVVYVGKDSRLKRPLALKFLRRKLLQDASSQDEFRLEAEITSRLEHPGVVPIHGFGTTESGQQFYAMRYIKGQTFDEAIAEMHEKPNSTQEHSREFRGLLNRFVALCNTIAYAHNRGIIHRDIKPANVMLGRYGETIVLDWGLAMQVVRDAQFKVNAEETLNVQSTESTGSKKSQGDIGTLAYMSPEQMAGSTDLQPACDIYALGVTLYKLLAGRIPVDEPTEAAMKQAIIRGDFLPPSRHNSNAPKAIEAICMKAMANKPEDRYRTALEIADQVERFLADEVVQDYQEPIGRKAARWARRHRRAVQVGWTAGALLLFAMIGFSVERASVLQSEREAYSELRKAQELTEQAFDRMALVEARTVSVAVQSQIEKRLLVVEQVARNPSIVEEVTKIYRAETKSEEREEGDYSESWRQLNDLLQLEREKLTSIVGSESTIWFVCLHDDNGTQIARAPFLNDEGERYDSLGKWYSYRQYYHGGKFDSRVKEIPQAIEQTFLAAPFKGTHGRPVCTFTAPIRSGTAGDESVVGVFGIAFDMNDLTTVDDLIVDRKPTSPSPEGPRQEQVLTIAYLPLSEFDKNLGSKQGQIMQHTAFKPAHEGGSDIPYIPRFLKSELVDRLEGSRAPLAEDDYTDPIGKLCSGYTGKWEATFAKITLPETEGRDISCSDTGWCVILQRRPREMSTPASSE